MRQSQSQIVEFKTNVGFMFEANKCEGEGEIKCHINDMTRLQYNEMND